MDAFHITHNTYWYFHAHRPSKFICENYYTFYFDGWLDRRWRVPHHASRLERFSSDIYVEGALDRGWLCFSCCGWLGFHLLCLNDP